MRDREHGWTCFWSSTVYSAVYPLHPAASARLIGDLAVFAVETSGPAPADALWAAGNDAERVRPPSGGEAVAGEVFIGYASRPSSPMPDGKVMELSRILEMRRSELDRYLIELMEQDTWIDSIRYLLGDDRISRRLWPR